MRLKITLLYRMKFFFPKMFEFKYRRVIAPHKDFVLLQRDPISFPRISNFSDLLAACNATIYAMTLKLAKNTCFTDENLRFVHAVRMITTSFLAVFRFVWMRNVQNVMFMGELCACPHPCFVLFSM